MAHDMVERVARVLALCECRRKQGWLRFSDEAKMEAVDKEWPIWTPEAHDVMAVIGDQAPVAWRWHRNGTQGWLYDTARPSGNGIHDVQPLYAAPMPDESKDTIER
jgi:hypothetical protein